MDEQIKKAAEEVLKRTIQPAEYKRRLMKLLENVTADNYTDADVKQVIELASDSQEES
jgi:hypothetical protein